MRIMFCWLIKLIVISEKWKINNLWILSSSSEIGGSNAKFSLMAMKILDVVKTLFAKKQINKQLPQEITMKKSVDDYRIGSVGALLDEHEKVFQELIALIEPINQIEYEKIIDADTDDQIVVQ